MTTDGARTTEGAESQHQPPAGAGPAPAVEGGVGLALLGGSQRILALQRSAGNQAVAQMLARQPAATETDIQKLDEMLGRFNVPESEVIALIRKMIPADRQTIATDAYRSRIASALDFGEMMQVVTVLPLPLDKKLEWLNAAATMTSGIDYGEIRALVTAAPQGERDALKNDTWKSFFVSVCDNTTILTALTDLGFDLVTKLTWLKEEASGTNIEYATIRPWIVAAPQADRDALKNDTWKSYFVDICTNATMVTALNDLAFDLATKLKWLQAEMTVTAAELDYGTIKPWIVAAPQGERDALNTTDWRTFFVQVCTNATMPTAVTDLAFKLQDKLRWMIAEGCGYDAFKGVIVAAADKAAALADAAFLGELKGYFSWNDFAKCVELLGRVIPGPGALIGDATVQAALAAAWASSGAAITPAPPAPAPPGVHEEGGFIYLNIITNTITTDRVSPGRQASLRLEGPNPPADAVTVGGYHTHPNVGPAWGPPVASPADTSWATRKGIPLLLRGAFPTVAATSDASTGPARAHLAGDREFPGATGGLAPQATIDGEEDEL
jgi:hypothetical protein